MFEEGLRALAAASARDARRKAGRKSVGFRLPMRRFVLLTSLLCFAGCARAEPGTVFGKPTVEDWEAGKRDRLNACQHDDRVESEKDAHRCLGAYDRHRGTDACVDATAWVSRVRSGASAPTVSGTAQREEVVAKPEVVATPEPAAEPSPARVVTVVCGAEGTLTVDGTAIQPGELGAVLAGAKYEGVPEASIACDQAPSGELVGIIDTLRAAGIRRFSLVEN